MSIERKTSTTFGILTGLILAGTALFSTTTVGDTVLNLTLTTNPDLEEDLVGHWTFDGPYTDISSSTAEFQGIGSGQHKLNWVNHATTTAQGVIGQGVDFDNVDDVIGIADPPESANDLDFGTGDFSLCLWYKTPDLGENDVLINKRFDVGNGYRLFLNTSGVLDFLIDDGSQTSGTSDGTTTLTDNNWHHICLLADRSDDAEFVINTVSNGVVDISARTGNINNTNDFCIGANNICVSGTGSFFPGGVIDDVRIYKRLLTSEDVQRLYDLGATTKENITLNTNPNLKRNLIGHWTFDGPNIDLSAVTAEIVDTTGQNDLNWLEHATTTAPGRIGQGVSFDDVDDSVGIADPGDGSLDVGTNDFSLCVWYKTPATGAFDALVSKRQGGNTGWVFGIDTSGNLDFRIDDGPLTTINSDGTTTLTDNNWHHICFVADRSGSVQFYVDTVDNGSGDISSNSGDISNSTDFCIGANGDCTSLPNLPAGGDIDDVRLYERTLSLSEINRLFDLGATTYQSVTLSSNDNLGNGLVGHWSFDGPHMVSNIADISGSDNDGALTGQTSTTTALGVLGQALEFDGTDDWVDMGDVLDSTIAGADEKFSFSAWIKTDSAGTNQTIIGKYNSDTNNRGILWRIFDSENSFHFEDNAAGDRRRIGGSTTLLSGAWYHFVVTYDGSVDTNDGLDRVKLYVNGARETESLDDTNGSLIDIQDNAAKFNIGSLVTGGSRTQFFDGVIDDMRVYDRLLSVEEIQRLYELGR